MPPVSIDILIVTIASVIFARRNDTEMQVANSLDTILRNVSLNGDEGYMKISRVPDFEWRLSCDAEDIAEGSDFSCNATVGKMMVVFYSRELVCRVIIWNNWKDEPSRQFDSQKCMLLSH